MFDPFAGSATTLIAAATLNRKAMSYEKDPAIYEPACRRLNDMKDQLAYEKPGGWF